MENGEGLNKKGGGLFLFLFINFYIIYYIYTIIL